MKQQCWKVLLSALLFFDYFQSVSNDPINKHKNEITIDYITIKTKMIKIVQNRIIPNNRAYVS